MRVSSLIPLALLALAAVLIVVAWRGERQRPSTLLAPGSKMPAIVAQGWIDDVEPSDEELRDQVLVVDVWAYWCKPCREAVPELLAAHRMYAADGVRFLGLTGEGKEELENSTRFVTTLDIPWPNAYGAQKTIQALGVVAIPTVFVVGRDGRITWHTDRGGKLNDAIFDALAQSPVSPGKQVQARP